MKDNIKLDLEETWYEDMGSVHLTQDKEKWRAFLYMVINRSVP
jgi:hypothetical protein